MSVTLPTFPTTAEILASLQAALQALNGLLSNYNAGGATETYLEAASLALGSDADSYPNVTVPGAYELLTQVQNAEFILTATGSYLDLKAADVGVTRKPAVAATGAGHFIAPTPPSSNEVISIGTLVAAEPVDPTANPIVYATTATATILAGQTTSNVVTFTAVAAGSSGNQVIGAVNQNINAPFGVSFANTVAATGGADIETDASLQSRALAAVPNASQGTKAALENAALSYAGVSSARLLDNTADDGVTPMLGRSQLYIDDGSGDLGDVGNVNHAIIATVQAAFDSGLYRAAGTQVHVVGSLLLAVTLNITIQVSQAYTQTTSSTSAIQTAAQLALFTYINSIALGRPVFVSEVISAAIEVGGVVNVPLTSVVINGVNGDLIPTPIQTPRCASLSSVNVTVVVVTP
jgi:uncharacterized phage protein gp47/JayE